MHSDLVNVTEAAEILRLKPSTMRAWVLRRKIPFVKLGRRVMFRRSDLEALIAGSVVPARPVFEGCEREQATFPAQGGVR